MHGLNEGHIAPFDSNKVFWFAYEAELQYIQANAQASMRDTSYAVRVGSMQKFEFAQKMFYNTRLAHIDGLAQDCSNSIANALELLQSCTKPSI